MEHANKPIVVYSDRISHVKCKHLKEFGNVYNITKVYNKLPFIIQKPDYIYYNKKTNGLEYYKRIANNICVAVRVNKSETLKIKSWYPVSDIKIKNRMKKDANLNNYDKTDQMQHN